MWADLNNAMLDTFNPTKLLYGYKLPKWRQKLHVLLGTFEKEILQVFFLMTNWSCKLDCSLFSFVPFCALSAMFFLVVKWKVFLEPKSKFIDFE